MIALPTGVRVWIAAGHTDMRRGMQSLALQVQEGLKRDPHGGDLYVFRGRSGSLIKILWHDGIGMSLYAKRRSAAGSFGRRPRPASFRSRRHNLPTCWMESIGEIPSTPGVRRRPAELVEALSSSKPERTG
jgi:transposase